MEVKARDPSKMSATKLQDDPTVSVVFKILSICVPVFCVVTAVLSVRFHDFLNGF